MVASLTITPQLFRTIAAADFPRTFNYCIRRDGYQTGAVQMRMARFLQSSTARKKLVLASRGFTKSYGSQSYTAWRLLRNPDLKVMVVSATKEFATIWLAGLKALIEHNPIFAPLRRQDGQRHSHRWTKTKVDVGTCTPTGQASVAVYGAETQITGAHVDLIILDDIEVPKNSRTVEGRAKLWQRIEELNFILNPPMLAKGKAFMVTPEVVVIGTYQSMHSIYVKLERSIGAEVLRIPALNAAGESNFPERFTTEYLLEEIKPGVSAAFWQLQMMLNPDLSDLEGVLPIRMANLRRTSGDDDPRCRLEMFLDPSGCTGGDEVGVVVGGVRNDNAYFHDWTGLTGGVRHVISEICDRVHDYRVWRITGESNMAGWEHFKDNLRNALHARRLRCTIVDDASKGDKHDRIVGTFNPITECGRLEVHPACIDNEYAEKTREQILNCTWEDLPPESIGDDRLDAGQLALRRLAKQFKKPMAFSYFDDTVTAAGRRAMGLGLSEEETAARAAALMPMKSRRN